MYLFIFESIGTSELILIGLIALIIFGPRKLPEMMKSFGKVMADFKRSTNEFKESWEREVTFENLEKESSGKEKLLESDLENSIGRDSYPLGNEITAPEIKEIESDDFEKIELTNEAAAKEKVLATSDKKNDLNDKRDWL